MNEETTWTTFPYKVIRAYLPMEEVIANPKQIIVHNSMNQPLNPNIHSTPPTITDEEVLAYAKYKYESEYEKKFRAGMEKYHSPIIEKDCVTEAFSEVWDLISYLATIKLQHSRALRLLDDFCEDFNVIPDPRLEEIRNLLSNKQPAVKKE